MKYLTTLALALLIPALSIGQYSLELDSFHKLSVFGSLEVRLVKGESARLEFPYEDNLPERFRLEAEDQKLSLRLVPRMKDWEDQPVPVIITYVELDELWVHAGAQLQADQPLEAEEIKLEGTMGARVKADIYAERLEVYATEGGVVDLGGKVRSLRAQAATGGQLEVHKLEARNAEAKAKSGGVVRLWVTERLKASAHMGGSVYYEGDPRDLDINSGVAGTVEDY